MWWSSQGDNLATSMTRPLDLSGKTNAALSLEARYDIESDYDYLYVQWSEDGQNWTALDGTSNGEPFVRDGSDTPAISGSSDKKWVDVEVPMDAITGKKGQLRFLYRTDGGVAPDGFFADEIKVVSDGAEVFADGQRPATTAGR